MKWNYLLYARLNRIGYIPIVATLSSASESRILVAAQAIDGDVSVVSLIYAGSPRMAIIGIKYPGCPPWAMANPILGFFIWRAGSWALP